MKKVILFSAVIVLFFTFHIKNCEAQWETDIRLTDNTATSSTTSNNARCIAANGNFIHTVWYDYRDNMSYAEIYYKRSTDGGVTWGADIRLTNNPAWSGNPGIAVSGSTVSVVWQDSRDGNAEIYCKRSTDGGANWGPDTRLTNNSANSWQPCIAASGSNVCIVWQDGREGNMEIYCKYSADGGASWGSDIRLTNNTAVSSYPSVAVSGSYIHIAWFDERDGNREIYYKLSADGGKNWGSDTRMTNNIEASHYPSIAASGSNVYIVWTDQRDGNREIFCKISADNGTNWGADFSLKKSLSSHYASVAFSGSNVHVVWVEGVYGNDEIFYNHSGDGGATWEEATRLTDSKGNSWYPSVAVSGSTVHVIWLDERDGNGEIYYKRNPNGE
ncbi:MAG: exo-alpha-sialidase [Ignavibacteriae bacterium]|nr:exo-alpha-sialidase [Ignavibacteriota bacterium]